MGKPARAERIGADETMDASKNPGGNESILVIYEVEPVSAGVFTLECVRLIACIYDICRVNLPQNYPGRSLNCVWSMSTQ